MDLEKIRQIKLISRKLLALESTINGVLNNPHATGFSQYSSYKQMALVYNDIIAEFNEYQISSAHVYTMQVDAMPGMGDSLPMQQKAILETTLLSARMLRAKIENNLDFVEDEIENLQNFIARKLRSIIYEVPKLEKEIQNAIETLLIGKGMSKGIDYDRETGKFLFSGREYIPDFIIQKLQLCIEVKLLREQKYRSKIIEEINADITAYSKEYANLLFVVYDLGAIRDEVEFKRDLENSGNVKVLLIKN
ncbi:hypothetical protein SDC9_72996 [bioreactor metagenome]|uniref:Uncharacterized protein n=1 Tax=bioreactor metagenome TaxID=1076179 RepID=A0A644YJ25_9ZZZZ